MTPTTDTSEPGHRCTRLDARSAPCQARDSAGHFGHALQAGGHRVGAASAIRRIGPGRPITLDYLLDFHRRLLTGTRLEAHGGCIRSEQNWIGGSDYNPCSAVFVPPPPETVRDLLEDLCRFCNEDSLPAVAQAAIAHAQFETIHPFADGNGRTGRALVHFVLRRRDLATRVLPPISLMLATWADDYIAGLQATRYRGPASSAAAHEGINLWVARFAAACQRAVADATNFEEGAQLLQREWRAKLGSAPGKLSCRSSAPHIARSPHCHRQLRRCPHRTDVQVRQRRHHTTRPLGHLEAG
jgi:Fic family protein